MAAEIPDPGIDTDVPISPGSRDFESFFKLEYPAVVRLAVALTGDMHAAEDLAQDAFLAARQRWDRISTYDQPGAWVRRVAVNRSVSRYRRRLSEAKAFARLSVAVPVELAEPDAAVWEAVRRLPRRQAQVITLTVLEDRTVHDVSTILGCGEETVRTHLRRARMRLAEQLGERDEVSET
jgi:RNA polymerase sigma-70 factor (ECF subfamily)